MVTLFLTLCAHWSVFNFLVTVSFAIESITQVRERLTFTELFPRSSPSQALQSHKTQGARCESKTQGYPEGQWKSFTLWCASQALLHLGPQPKRQGDREACRMRHSPLWTPDSVWLYNGHPCQHGALTVRDSQMSQRLPRTPALPICQTSLSTPQFPARSGGLLERKVVLGRTEQGGSQRLATPSSHAVIH